MLGDNDYLDMDNGLYWGEYFEGTFQMRAFDGCYLTKTLPVTLKRGQKHTQNIQMTPKWNYSEMDINADERIDLTDIIIFMKILSDDQTMTHFYQQLTNRENVSFQLFICAMKQLCNF